MAELTEVVAEAADEVAEQASHVAEVSRALSSREVRLVVVAAAAGIAGGFAIGYFVTKRRLETKFSTIADEEIDLARTEFQEKLANAILRERAHYEAKARAPKPEIDNVMRQLGYQAPDEEKPPAVEPEEVAEIAQNVFEANRVEFDKNTAEWDYAKEVKSRDPDVPYVIHKDEYTQNEKEYEQATLTYYEGDDVLAAHDDSVIDDQDETVGVENLGKFGHGSGDPLVVHVRNDRLGIDYEIVKSNGTFSQEVHGFRHSDEPAKRSRPEWDG